ncbi:TPA: hypothetical protein EYN09_03830 [Candidatus Poribacteria bacterium]|nr:hypothetical protein [Candidatus Poribacteria bacterium]
MTVLIAVLRRSYEWDANQPTQFVESTNVDIWGSVGFSTSDVLQQVPVAIEPFQWATPALWVGR